MASANQVRGVLLEEAILALLRASGYRTVTKHAGDPTLDHCGAGLIVLGRGGRHQIDAIADLRIAQPFTNPQRLLVEAKAYSDGRTVGLQVIRGAVGVLKDVSEYWVRSDSDEPGVPRYHYQFAVFRTSDFSPDAQDYAFAHDVHLLPLRASSFFRPVVTAIETSVANLPVDRNRGVNLNLSDVRQVLRGQLQNEGDVNGRDTFPWLDQVVNATGNVGESLIATLGTAMPVFLTPRRGLNLDQLPTSVDVRIHFEHADQSWTITRAETAEPLFTFDLPTELFELFARNGVLSRRAALDLKQQYFAQFTAIYSPRNSIRIFNFRLDQGWVERLRDGLGQRRRG